MTAIHPCRGCPIREGCEHRDVLRKAARKTGAVSIKYRCDKLGAQLRPGRRIVITAPVAVPIPYSHEPEFRIVRRPVRATMASVGGYYEFSAIVDPGELPEGDHEEKHRFRRRAGHYRIVRFLDEPDAKLCGLGNVMRGDVCDRIDKRDPCGCKQFGDAA